MICKFIIKGERITEYYFLSSLQVRYTNTHNWSGISITQDQFALDLLLTIVCAQNFGN